MTDHYSSCREEPEIARRKTLSVPTYPGADIGIISEIIKWNADAGRTTDHFNARQTALNIGLQCEELAEKLVAVGLEGIADTLSKVGDDFKNGFWDNSVATGDRKAMLDADCDILVVTVGSAISQGADFIGAMREVNRSNNSKRGPDGVLHKDANGKITKGPNYSPPVLDKFLAKA